MSKDNYILSSTQTELDPYQQIEFSIVPKEIIDGKTDKYIDEEELLKSLDLGSEWKITGYQPARVIIRKKL